ncbi:MAG: hybrid sensor histidine kinase/response regulator [Caulobacter sp. 12-67-6]|nr:MAG: hybrid sensor histidine kinase/response regulator [Caulobacter sp. 12-67-6]OYX71321.1 MAG: hybrid sensor histidine kinase/response regulator [Caulobacter sp. 32-67-35]
MAGYWEDLAVAYRPAAVSRRNQVPLRLFVILALCGAMAWRPDFGFLLGWTLAYLVAQVAELQALRRFLNHPDPASTVGFNLVTDLLMATVFGWMAIPLWQVGTPAAAAAATLLISGSILTALMGAEGCFTAFLSAVTPHLVYLFLLPLVSGSASDPVTPYFLLGVGLLSLVLAMVFTWSRRAMQAERSARLAAEAQTAAKSAFVAMVSHELRTPINALLNGAATLERQEGADRGAASLIADAGAMMKTLLNDLLDYSKIEAGRMGVEIVDYDLRGLVRDSVLLWRGEARSKGVKLELKGIKALPVWVRGDPMRLRQILNNLLSNAIKFTAEGGVVLTIAMQERAEGRHMVIEVVDTGPGLTEEQISRLFIAYDQLGAGTARAFGGTGLGLAISRDLAGLMGGTLTAASDAGGGARFTLTLPAPEGAAPPSVDLSSPSPLVATAQAPLVLVVDDHDINRRTLRGMLEAFGARVETAEDAESALEAVHARVFDAILMDVRMPGVDGLEATRRLRASGLNRDTPVIAVTGAASVQDIEACRAAGMTGLVEKPVAPSDLYAALFSQVED